MYGITSFFFVDPNKNTPARESVKAACVFYYLTKKKDNTQCKTAHRLECNVGLDNRIVHKRFPYTVSKLGEAHTRTYTTLTNILYLHSPEIIDDSHHHRPR